MPKGDRTTRTTRKGGKSAKGGAHHQRPRGKVTAKDSVKEAFPKAFRRPAIRRLCRRAGIKRLSATIYDSVRHVAKIYLDELIRHTLTYTGHARRKTVVAMDVVYALKNQFGQKHYLDTPVK